MSIKESALSAVTSIANSDFVRIVTSSGASRKITLENLLRNSVNYKAGDVFSARNWRAMGRSINSGKGIYCWIDFGRPILATGANISIGSMNPFCNSDATYPTFANTVSSVTVSGNELYFVVDTTNTLEAGKVYLIEFSGTSITLT